MPNYLRRPLKDARPNQRLRLFCPQCQLPRATPVKHRDQRCNTCGAQLVTMPRRESPAA